MAVSHGEEIGPLTLPTSGGKPDPGAPLGALRKKAPEIPREKRQLGEPPQEKNPT